MVAQNMTTLCENWLCGFHDPGGGSQNHIMYVATHFMQNTSEASEASGAAQRLVDTGTSGRLTWL